MRMEEKGMVMRIERAADATERVVICRTFCVLRLKNEFGMINSRIREQRRYYGQNDL